jgi:hypothetical protein
MPARVSVASAARAQRFERTHYAALLVKGVFVLVDERTASDASALLRVVLPELAATATVTTGAVSFSLTSDWRDNNGTVDAERCARARSARGGLSVSCGGLLGLAYAVHELRDALSLSDDPARGIDAFEAAAPSPVFGVRAWSEEGTLLALPDRGYYSSDGSRADVVAIAAEAAALEAEIIPALLRLRMNTLIVLHSNVEDYVTYDTLQSFLPGAPPIYNASDAHRTRRADIVSVMAPWIAHLNADFGIAFYFQVYELSSPPGVCTPSADGTRALFNCSLHSPATTALARAKYSELAAALPALSGLFITVEDSWSPRAGYMFSVLLSSTADMALAINLFHDAVTSTANLSLYFRLWAFGEAIDWQLIIKGTPAGVRLSIKQTAGDFLLDHSVNPLLICEGSDCPPQERRVIIEVDAFRQYNGWTSGVCYMGSIWAERLSTAVQSAHGNSIDVWGWGSWAPGCTWPDSGPQLLNATDGEYKSWRSWWNSYRMFNATPTNGGFSLGGQSNAYALQRLSWDAAANATQIALDFGTLFYGQPNAPHIAAILNQSSNAWLQTSSPAALGDGALFWTVMQRNGNFTSLASQFDIDSFDVGRFNAATIVETMRSAFAQIDPAAVPTQNPDAYEGARRAIEVTARYLDAYFAWRTAGLSVAQLLANPAPFPVDCEDSVARVGELRVAVDAFDAEFPFESAAWVIGNLDPALYSHPPFLNSLERTMRDYAVAWGAAINTVDACCC